MKKTAWKIVAVTGLVVGISYCSLIVYMQFIPLLDVRRDPLWSKANQAIHDGLPKTASHYLDQIMQKDAKEGIHDEWLLARLRKIQLEGGEEGGSSEENIQRLRKCLLDIPAPVQPLARVVLALWYRQYYDENNWRFAYRTAVSDEASEEISTWDLRRIFREIDKLYQGLLSEPERFQNIPVDRFSLFLERGTTPKAWRPTLYDFIAHEALSFYAGGEWAVAQPENAWEPDAQSPAMGNRESFLAWRLTPEEATSPPGKIVGILQELLRFHEKEGNLPALVDADLRRIQLMKNLTLGENLEGRAIQALEELTRVCPREEITALVQMETARCWQGKGDLVRAVAAAREGETRFPKTPGGESCRAIISEITQKRLHWTGERSIPPGKGELRLTVTNVDRIFFRIYKKSWDHEVQTIHVDETPGEYIKAVFREKPLFAWKQDFPSTSSYQPRKETVRLPWLDVGCYRIFASDTENYQQAEMVQFTSLQVSNLTCLTRGAGGMVDGFVLEAISGEPVPGAAVQLFHCFGDSYCQGKSTLTDTRGHFQLNLSRRNGDHRVMVRKGKDRLIAGADENGNDDDQKHARTQVLFFTDRSLYRPGQTIHFKGICIRVDPAMCKYQTVSGLNVTVRLRDVNGQEVENREFRSNDFGSFSGSFTAAAGRLLGPACITAEEYLSRTDIRVEEYKRPKFYVEMENPARQFRLGDEVEVPGRAIGYAGAAVDGARVCWRVVREARWPWWWSRFRNCTPSTSREIAHGNTVTDGSGRFSIRFPARPDAAISPKDEPTFDFQVFADVTDGAGETRTAQFQLPLACHAMELTLNTGGVAIAGIPFALTIRARNVAGETLAAKGEVKVFRLQEPAQPVRDPLAEDDDPSEDSGNKWTSWPAGPRIRKEVFAVTAEKSARLTLCLPAGMYRVVGTCTDIVGHPVEGILPLMVLPDGDEKKFPLKIPFLACLRQKQVQVGETAEALWGTGYTQGRAIYEVFHEGKLVRRAWTPAGVTQFRVRVLVEEKHRGGFVIRFLQVRENRMYDERLLVNVPWDNQDLQLSFETFRDTLLPGAKETVKVRIQGFRAMTRAVEMVTAMYDASLDQIYPHGWPDFSFFRRDPGTSSFQFAGQLTRSVCTWERWNKSIPFPDMSYFHLPELANQSVHLHSPRMVMAFCAAPPAPNDVATEYPATQLVKGSRGEMMVLPVSQETEEALARSVKVRQNLSETAFFYPHLLMAKDGTVTIQFTMPEAVTRWNFLGFAHDRECRHGHITGSLVTRKDLMVQPNLPRFLREGDGLEITTRVVNLSDQPQIGTVRMELRDLLNQEPAAERLHLSAVDQPFKIVARASAAFSWRVQVPKGMGPLSCTVTARAAKTSDGETGAIPVLSSRILVSDTVPLWARGNESRDFRLPGLARAGQPGGPDPHRLVVQVVSQPAWYAVLALPFLMEYPYECAEQTFNRYYANRLARHLALSNPLIRRMMEQWKGTPALDSPLEKNQALKEAMLEETPWVLDSRVEGQARRRVALLFEENTVEQNLLSARMRLQDLQLSDGGWAWFSGGPADDFITLYILAGFGKLRNLDASVEREMTPRALEYADRWIVRYYDHIPEENRPNHQLDCMAVMYLYSRSFFLSSHPIPDASRAAVRYFLEQGRKYWLPLGHRMSQGQLALAFQRFGDPAMANKIVASLRERAVHDHELGMFWKDEAPSWQWCRAPIETQSVMIEVFQEAARDPAAVEELRVWLLKQKQVQDWKTTKATADAVYALLGWKSSKLEKTTLAEIRLGNTLVRSGRAETGTGFYQKIFSPDQIRPGMVDIQFSKKDSGIAWGGVHFQYFQELDQVASQGGNLSVEKTLYKVQDTQSGPELVPVSGPLSVGDQVTVRLVLRVDRDMEYIHLKDMRGSGLEPVDVLSGYRYQDGPGYYQATRDTGTHFFLEYLPKGTHVFQYGLRVQHRGRYQAGIATIRCMYAPEFSAHSASTRLEVR